MATRPSAAMARTPMVGSQSSGQDGKPSAVIVQCAATMVAISNARIPAPNSQLSTITTRRTTWAMGRAAGKSLDKAVPPAVISKNDNILIVFRQDHLAFVGLRAYASLCT